MITELTTSSVALAIQELSKEKKIDIVVGAATSRLTGDACRPYGFHWPMTPTPYGSRHSPGRLVES